MGRDKEVEIKDNNSKTDKKMGEDTEKTFFKSTQFPVVGIGASAGGLAAFEAFFSGLEADTNTGMAFVLVQHLAPSHTSILAELIQKYTYMTVLVVSDGIMIKPNHIYVIPPNKDMIFYNGGLYLFEPTAIRGIHLPINIFFDSLAKNLKEFAIGIVLSGTGSDGSLGLKAIKNEGGMAMAQSPESSEYEGMPSHAIETGLIDFVLSPKAMMTQLIDYVATSYGELDKKDGSIEMSNITIHKIFALLLNHTGHDFSLYKPNTINRRIERRLAVNRFHNVEDYIEFLKNNEKEIEALFYDLLIGVTSFFRDEKAFKKLETIFAKMILDKKHNPLFRIWIAGCSTGEEVYSLAMLLCEAEGNKNEEFKVQIFGTDIDPRAVATARLGVYSSALVEKLTPERIKRFFDKNIDGTSYSVKKKLRDIIVFSEQNVIKDPPFSRLDFISCRNLLIYMGVVLQKKTISLFHYALNPNGYLFLGTSETIGEFDALFKTIESESKIYQKKDSLLSNQTIFNENISHYKIGVNKLHKVIKDNNKAIKRLPLQKVTEQALIKQMPQTAVLVDHEGNILYFHGSTGKYLEPAQGIADGNNLLRMAREGLKLELSMALYNIIRSRDSYTSPNINMITEDQNYLVKFSIHSVASEVDDQRLFLVILEQVIEKNSEEMQSSIDNNSNNSGEIIINLQERLKTQEAYILASNKEIEVYNEELRSSNEEMQSVNEELQSTNEELETSKEELQSVNEELSTVNIELQSKVVDLSQVNNDMNSLLSATDIGIVFIDFDLNILRFTPTIAKVINLISADIGRSIEHIATNLIGYKTLVEDCHAVLDTLIPIELEVMTKNGTTHIMTILPYRTLENVIEGAVVTFVDITEYKKVEEEVRTKHIQLAEAMVHTVIEPMLVLDDNLKVILANKSFYDSFGLEADNTIGKLFYDLDHDKWDIPELRRLLEDILPSNEVFNDYKVTLDRPKIGPSTMLINARQLIDEKYNYKLILLAIHDISEDENVFGNNIR